MRESGRREGGVVVVVEGGGWNGEDVRALGRGWRQAALRWKPDQTLCLSEQLL